MIGSSPLTRGIQIRRCHPLQGLRFIPAHAGNTPCLLSDVQVLEVHPRSRGEYRLLMPLILTSVGSSPLTRGIQNPGHIRAYSDGFIPAHAGNTLYRLSFQSLSQVHPRARGEYPKCMPNSV